MLKTDYSASERCLLVKHEFRTFVTADEIRCLFFIQCPLLGFSEIQKRLFPNVRKSDIRNCFPTNGRRDEVSSPAFPVYFSQNTSSAITSLFPLL